MCPLTCVFWFPFSVLRNADENQKPQLTGQGYMFTYIIFDPHQLEATTITTTTTTTTTVHLSVCEMLKFKSSNVFII